MSRSAAPGTLFLLILLFASMLIACTRISSVMNSVSPSTYSGNGVDAYISPALSPHDHNVMRNVMLLLRPTQWRNVVFFDIAGDGRIYSNRPELLNSAFYYKPVPGEVGVYGGPEGQMLMLPRDPPPNEGSLQPQSGLPTRDSTGPFYRLSVSGTSWMSNTITPDFWPGPTPAPTQYSFSNCDDYVIQSGDEGFFYMGAYANLQSSNPSQVEFGLGFQKDLPSKGFAPYMAVVPKPAATATITGYSGFYGCFDGESNDLIFSVLSTTMIEGVFGPVFKDGRPCPCYPATNEQVTYVQSVPSSDGFNATGSNMATYLNVTIAQSPIPKGYKMDGSFFSMRIGNNGDSASDDAGIGTFTKQTGSCLLENPTGYDTGQAGLCTGGSLLFQAAHPFPTPSPNVVHVVTYGGSGPMSVNICLGSPLCAGVPVWQQQ